MTLSIGCIATTFGATKTGDFIRTANGEVGIVGYCHSKQTNVLASFRPESADLPCQVTRVILDEHENVLSFGSEFDFRFDMMASAEKVFPVYTRIPVGALVVNEHGVSVIASDGRQKPAPIEISFIVIPSDRERYNQSAFHVLEWQLRHRAESLGGLTMCNVVARES